MHRRERDGERRRSRPRPEGRRAPGADRHESDGRRPELLVAGDVGRSRRVQAKRRGPAPHATSPRGPRPNTTAVTKAKSARDGKVDRIAGGCDTDGERRPSGAGASNSPAPGEAGRRIRRGSARAARPAASGANSPRRTQAAGERATSAARSAEPRSRASARRATRASDLRRRGHRQKMIPSRDIDLQA